MDIQELKKYIKLAPFLKDYCNIDASGSNSYVRHKIRGKDSANNPLSFNDTEKGQIRDGLTLLIADLKRQRGKK